MIEAGKRDPALFLYPLFSRNSPPLAEGRPKDTPDHQDRPLIFSVCCADPQC
jgi:hypothetical protein